MIDHEQREDHNFYATIRTSSGPIWPSYELRRVLCRLWLPKRPADAVRMVFYPTEKQARSLPPGISPFKISGKKIELPGNTTFINASQTWDHGIPRRALEKGRIECVFEADPLDLQVFTRRHRNRSKKRVIKYTNYFLAHSIRELTPFKVVRHMGNGTTYSKTVRKFAFTLRGKRHLRFDERYHYERPEASGETVEWTDLVAKEKCEIDWSDFAKVDEEALADLDDFLLLVSFSAQHRIVCVGMEAFTDDADHFQFFRKSIVVPPRAKQNRYDAVIDLAVFSQFIRTAYECFVKLGPHELIRHAIHLVLPSEDRTVEADYTSLYAALETIILWHRQCVGLEHIIEDDEEWRQTRSAIGDFLKQQRALSDKKRRAMMHLKLGELRRVPFATAFDDFCVRYHVDLNDLWPVNGKEKDMPLATIRNHIVHGSVFDRQQLSALSDAREHLRWVVGRMLLALLKWPVEQSNLKKSTLMDYTAMLNLGVARHAMQKLPTVTSVELEA